MCLRYNIFSPENFTGKTCTWLASQTVERKLLYQRASGRPSRRDDDDDNDDNDGLYVERL